MDSRRQLPGVSAAIGQQVPGNPADPGELAQCRDSYCRSLSVVEDFKVVLGGESKAKGQPFKGIDAVG